MPSPSYFAVTSTQMPATRDCQILRAALLELHRTTGLSGTIARDIAEKGQASNVVVKIAIENGAQLFVAAIKSDDCPETPVVIKEKFANSGYVGDSGEAERTFRREAERHSGMISNTIGA